MLTLNQSRKTEFLNSVKKNNEIEVKFYDKDIESINLLKKVLYEKNYENFSEKTLDYLYEDGKRITVYENGDIEETTKTVKFKYGNMNINNMKYTISEEKKEKILTFDKNYKIERKKNRISYTKDNYRIDITIVNDSEIPEVELELLKSELLDYKEFMEKIKELYMILLPYEKKVKVIKQFFNDKLKFDLKNVEKDKSLNEKYFSKARDITIKDLNYDGLIKNKYTLSVKADGKNKFLIYHDTGIWLVSPHSKEDFVEYLTYPSQQITNSIFVGELLISKDMKKGKEFSHKYKFLPYDTLLINDKKVLNKDYFTRFKNIDLIKNSSILKDGFLYLEIEEKKIFDYSDVKSFYETTQKCFEEITSVDYETDGIIFTPINSNYIAEGQLLQKSEWFKNRILNKNKDVCKWKPRENITIDYKVKYDKKKYYLSGVGNHLTKNQNKSPEPFTLNSPNNTFLKDFTDIYLKLDDYYINLLSKEDQIIEFKVNNYNSGYELEAIRVRSEKSYPNSYYVIDSLWYLIKDPVLKSTLLGTDTKLMRKFNNNIKTKLLEDINGYVLDIGTGKGGDIFKYKNAKKVICVEPNKEFYSELNRRLLSYNDSDKFVTINTNGEDKTKITKTLENELPENMENETLYISFMISLTFFWKDEKNLSELADTINSITEIINTRGGSVSLVFLTISGKYITKLFSDSSFVELNTILIKKLSENSVDIEIKDSATVLQKQTEYLVNVNDLMKLIGFKLLILNRPKTKNVLMSENELTYISVHQFGFAVYEKEPTIIQVKKPLFVNEKQAKKIDGKIKAAGDDVFEKLEYMGSDFFRISTLKNKNLSLLHSISKLTSSEYRDGGPMERTKYVKSLFKKVKQNLDFDNIIKYFKISICVYFGDKVIKYLYESTNNFIFLNKCTDDIYEPIIRIINDDIQYYFESPVELKTLNFPKFKEISLTSEKDNNNIYFLYALTNTLLKLHAKVITKDALEDLDLDIVYYNKSGIKNGFYESPEIKYSYNNISTIVEKLDNMLYDKLFLIDKLALEQNYKEAISMCFDTIKFFKSKYYSIVPPNIKKIIDKSIDLISVYDKKVITLPKLDLDI